MHDHDDQRAIAAVRLELVKVANSRASESTQITPTRT